MDTILGIDIGTSGIKAMLLDIESGETYVESSGYAVDIPFIGWAEQAPDMWWGELKNILQTLKKNNADAFESIRAIGFSGQMHGLVLIDKNGRPLRPAIIALDQRSGRQVAEIQDKVPPDELKSVMLNRPFTGFAFPSLLWIRDNEPDILSRTYKALQPKDYIRLKMTGKAQSDMSDASATLAFNVGKREWAWDIIERFKLPSDIFPECFESYETAGFVTAECAEETGLPAGIPVVYGCGDQQAQSIGNGVIREGVVVANIGTSGQISTYLENAVCDGEMRTHTFCHAFNRAYTVFGATLCSGMSLKWLKNNILHVDSYEGMSDMAAEIPPGSGGVVYLPYLSGERTPHMNHNASGEIFGLKLGHDRRHLIRAVMEGVTYSLKNSLDLFAELNIKPRRIIASGGGASSPVWLQMQADIFETEIAVCDVKEQACLGACILAGVGAGRFASVHDACERFVKMKEKVYSPIPERFEVYRKGYTIYNRIYENTKDLMEV